MPAAEGLTKDDENALLDYFLLREPGVKVIRPEDSGELRYTFSGYHKLVDQTAVSPRRGAAVGIAELHRLEYGQDRVESSPRLLSRAGGLGEDNTGAENFGGAMVTRAGLLPIR